MSKPLCLERLSRSIRVHKDNDNTFTVFSLFIKWRISIFGFPIEVRYEIIGSETDPNEYSMSYRFREDMYIFIALIAFLFFFPSNH